MSRRDGQHLQLLRTEVDHLDDAKLSSLFNEVLNAGLHGLGFSPYEENQAPGETISEEQIRRRMEIIRPYTSWIRSFSCSEGNELIPKIAKEYGLKTMVGAWLDQDRERNGEEIATLIRLVKEGLVDIAAVGNEVLYREELEEEELLSYIRMVKEKTENVPVAYVDAYYEFENRPKLTEECDVILANCYPFWEGCALDYAPMYMQDMYRRAKAAAPGKRVIISETGWPNRGQHFHGAYPSDRAAMEYFIKTQIWAKNEGVEMFYFSSFDEGWKIGQEGDVGAYWGIWDSQEKLKYQSPKN